MSKPRVAFREEQAFRQLWLVILMTFCMCLGPVMMWIDFSFKLSEFGFEGKAVELFWGAIFATLLCGAIFCWFFWVRLITEVRDDGVYLYFRGLWWAWIPLPFEGLKSARARHYRPIVEFGGWGVRYGWKIKAYNVRGDEGVELEWEDGKRILIGSQQAKKLERAIHKQAGL